MKKLLPCILIYFLSSNVFPLLSQKNVSKLRFTLKNSYIPSDILSGKPVTAIGDTSFVYQVNKSMNAAFFCRLEYEASKTSKIQLKYRLGTIQYVDKLEGKN